MSQSSGSGDDATSHKTNVSAILTVKEKPKAATENTSSKAGGKAKKKATQKATTANKSKDFEFTFEATKANYLQFPKAPSMRTIVQNIAQLLFIKGMDFDLQNHLKKRELVKVHTGPMLKKCLEHL